MEIIWWKTAQYRKIGQKIHFFIKFLCSPILMELDQDIWQIIFELVRFCEITIGKALALSSFVLEGGLEFGSPCMIIMMHFMHYAQNYALCTKICFPTRPDGPDAQKF